MTTLLLTVGALVALTAIGAGTLLCVAAASEQIDKSEEAERRASAEREGGRRG